MLPEPGHSESRTCYSSECSFPAQRHRHPCTFCSASLWCLILRITSIPACNQLNKRAIILKENRNLDLFFPSFCLQHAARQPIPLLSLIHFPLSHCLTVNKVSGKTDKPKWSNQPELSADVCILRGKILFPVCSMLVPNACLDWEQLAVSRFWQDTAIMAGRSTW